MRRMQFIEEVLEHAHPASPLAMEPLLGPLRAGLLHCRDGTSAKLDAKKICDILLVVAQFQGLAPFRSADYPEKPP